jgi:hypothetical protein
LFQTQLKSFYQQKKVDFVTLRDFCARVYAHEQLGVGPVKQYDEHKTKKRVLPVLNSHKKWLESFKKDIKVQK